MKTTILAILLAFFGLSTTNAQVGIGTTTPAPTAILDLTATNKGFLPPRMTTAQRNAITSPAAGLVIYNTTVNCLQWWNSTGWFNACDGTITAPPIAEGACAGEPTFFTFNGKEYKPVVSSGKCWLDRNLGANQAATSSEDAAAYGDLYQWGRATDGHQLRTSSNTALNATVDTDTPPHGDFITTNVLPSDWRGPQNDNLWQGVNGINNPCPTGYRLPTDTELDQERTSWSSNNAAGAFASPLKLPLATYREILGHISGDNNGEPPGGPYYIGYYWSGTVSGIYARSLNFNNYNSNSGSMYDDSRGLGFSVRCIKN